MCERVLSCTAEGERTQSVLRGVVGMEPKTAEELSSVRPEMHEQVERLVTANSAAFDREGGDEDEDSNFPRPSARGVMALTELLMTEAPGFQRELRLFADHARRKKIAPADVMMLARKHPETLKSLKKFEREQARRKKDKTAGASRKKQARAGEGHGGGGGGGGGGSSARKRQRIADLEESGEDDGEDHGMSHSSEGEELR